MTHISGTEFSIPNSTRFLWHNRVVAMKVHCTLYQVALFKH